MKTDWTKEELIKVLRQCSKEIGHTPTEKEYEIWRKSKMNAGLTSEQVGNFLVLLEDANDSQLGAMIKTIEQVIKAREMKK